MSYEMIAFFMFATMMLLLLTGQRVFGAIGFVAFLPLSCCGARAAANSASAPPSR
jgi:hypothetical protein